MTAATRPSCQTGLAPWLWGKTGIAHGRLPSTARQDNDDST
jgi:hypothetical protein